MALQPPTRFLTLTSDNKTNNRPLFRAINLLLANKIC